MYLPQLEASVPARLEFYKSAYPPHEWEELGIQGTFEHELWQLRSMRFFSWKRSINSFFIHELEEEYTHSSIIRWFYSTILWEKLKVWRCKTFGNPVPPVRVYKKLKLNKHLKLIKISKFTKKQYGVSYWNYYRSLILFKKWQKMRKLQLIAKFRKKLQAELLYEEVTDDESSDSTEEEEFRTPLGYKSWFHEIQFILATEDYADQLVDRNWVYPEDRPPVVKQKKKSEIKKKKIKKIFKKENWAQYCFELKRYKQRLVKKIVYPWFVIEMERIYNQRKKDKKYSRKNLMDLQRNIFFLKKFLVVYYTNILITF